MSSEEIFKRLPAFIPLILLAVLVSFFAYSVRTYVQCLQPDCGECNKVCEINNRDKQEECEKDCAKLSSHDEQKKCKDDCRFCPKKCVSIMSNLDNILFARASDEEKTKNSPTPPTATPQPNNSEEAEKQASEQSNKPLEALKAKREDLKTRQGNFNNKLNADQKLKAEQEALNREEEQLNKREAEINKQEEDAKKQQAEAAKKADLKNREKLAVSFSGRMVFVFLANLYFLICLIAALIGIYIIYQTCKQGVFYGWTKGVSYARRVVAAAIALTGLVLFVLYYKSDWFMVVFNLLLEGRIADDLPWAQEILRSVNAFGFAVGVLLYLAVVSILFSPVKRTSPEGFVDAAQKMRYLRTILYIGTLMLVVGVLLIRSVHQWTLAFIASREEQMLKIAENFFANLLAVDGGFFTLLLAAAYLPAAFIVRWQVEQIGGLPQVEAEKEKTLQNYHLAFSFNEALPKIIAILGPILAGPVGDLFTRLIK